MVPALVKCAHAPAQVYLHLPCASSGGQAVALHSPQSQGQSPTKAGCLTARHSWYLRLGSARRHSHLGILGFPSVAGCLALMSYLPSSTGHMVPLVAVQPWNCHLLWAACLPKCVQPVGRQRQMGPTMGVPRDILRAVQHLHFLIRVWFGLVLKLEQTREFVLFIHSYCL